MAWTQLGLTILFFLLLAFYAGMRTLEQWGRRPAALVTATTLALFVAAVLMAGRYVAPAPVAFGEHGLYPFQLFSAKWGWGISQPGTGDGLSFQLGMAAAGLAIVGLALWWQGRSKAQTGTALTTPDAMPLPTGLTRTFWVWLAALIIVSAMTLAPAAWFWTLTGLDNLLIYPWQALALTGLPLAFLGGALPRLDRRLAELPLWAGIVAFVILSSYPYLAPRFTSLDPGPNPVAMFQPVKAAVPQILVLDTQIAPPTEITPTLTLTVTWQALEPVAGDYTVFAHLLAGDDTKASQRDVRPCNGECPTNTWMPGELVVDRYDLALAADAPPGPYRLALGLYLLDTGDRALVVGRDDRTVFLHVP
jgi:hypothetical protein